MVAPPAQNAGMTPPLKLHLGCGRTILPGWLNVDIVDLPGVDLVADFDSCRTVPLPLGDDSVGEVLMSHVIEHVDDTLALMQELWRVSIPGASMTVRLPYGSSDDAWEDPTHRRPYFLQSFGYFSAPYYWRADYGYRGDWYTDRITLRLDPAIHDGADRAEIMRRIHHLRNQVVEMVVELHAVKPARPADRSLQHVPPMVLEWTS